jgi:hypothetical protein
MPSNTLDGLAAELAAAVAVVTPQINGFQGILSVPTLSGQTQQAMQADLDAHKRRAGLLSFAQQKQANLEAAIVALVDDGYPAAVVEVPLTADIVAELEAQRAAYSAAFGEIGLGDVSGDASGAILGAVSDLKTSSTQLQNSVDANQPPATN